ncbi:MAG: phosphomannomutase/phosphoglucomutase [Alphaproteobacteria bacterium]|nr:phosphomannomutase/phosphoglucomutase [Alphaproteobacteria bacterium]
MTYAGQVTSSLPGKPYHFDPAILREYDIRGEVGKNLGPADALALGRAFGTYVIREAAGKEHCTICTGYDGRDSSPELVEALIAGLISTGAHVVNVGRGPSPMLYFAVQHLQADAGIMVTGSHNPPEYNGFKMTMLSRGVFGPAVQEIGQIAETGSYVYGEGKEITTDLRAAYTDRLLQDAEIARPLKVVWDAGNGAAGEIMARLAHSLPGEHILLYGEIDGAFPHHHPDPTVDENLADLRHAVLENGCDLGVAFDGDGDRIGAVDENGNVVRCDTLLEIYAREVLAMFPGAPVIGDVKCSQVLYDEISRLGGTPVMWKTGHSLVKDKMRELTAPLAGELSGHIFFADRYYGYDDALYAALRLLNAVSRVATGGLSVLTRDLPVLYNTPEIRIPVKEDDKFALVAQVQDSLGNRSDVDIVTIDGLRVKTPDGWWLLRASNTQGVLTLRAESTSEDGLTRLTSMMCEEVEKLGYVCKL